MTLPVLETEYLLALRAEDKKHQAARDILSGAESGEIQGLIIAGSSIIELAFGLRGKFQREEIVETLEIIRGVTDPIPISNLDIETLIRGLRMENKIGRPNLFDCLHASTALGHDGVIVSSDPFFDSIEELRRLDFKELLRHPSI